MTTFENIKSQWKNQSEPNSPDDGPNQIIKKTNSMKKKQRITYIVLGITTLILVYFFFYIEAYLITKVTLALGLMIGGLIIRIILELFSIKALNNMKVDGDVNSFKSKLTKYYKGRIGVHYIVTPIVLVAYVLGFIMLLPYFKESLSSGFYTYIQISGALVFVIGILLIFKQIKMELNKIRELTQ